MGFLRFALLLVCSSSCVTAASVRHHLTNSSEAPRANVYGEINDTNLLLPTLALQTATEPITLYIDSPGGEVSAGLSFIEEMHATQRRGVPVVCVVEGMAASMAAVILENCTVRLMHKQSALLFHTVSISGAGGGNQWTYERLAKRLKEMNHWLAIIASGRMKISLAEYEERVRESDWWLGYEEALQVGAVDGVL